MGFGACASAPELYYRHELADQILKPRPGYAGLTNRACAKFDDDGVCQDWQVEAHSLDDANFRQTVNTLGMVCNIGGRRFKVCLDKPGFCRIWYTDCGLFCRKKRHEEYIPASNEQLILASKTRCMDPRKYPFETWGGGSWGVAGTGGAK